MSLVTVEELRALVNSSLGDADLQEVIERVEFELAARIGAAQDDNNSVTISQTLHGKGQRNLFVKNEIGSVESIVEDGITLDSSQYRFWAAGMIERLPAGSYWGQVCVVTFKPVDDRPARKTAIIDLARLDLNRTAFLSENVAGEYSYTAPQNWEAERLRILRRVGFPVAG